MSHLVSKARAPQLVRKEENKERREEEEEEGGGENKKSGMESFIFGFLI